MSIVTRTITWPSWKFGVLKLSMVAFGILVGAYFHEFWRPWEAALWILFGVTSLLTSYWGCRALFAAKAGDRAAD